MEKTLREESNLHFQIIQKIQDYETLGDFGGTQSDLADSILTLLSQRIKAKALTDGLPECDWDMLYDLANGSETLACKMYAKVCLKAQLQAVLGELE
jgi:hypothetical protein